MISTMGKNAIYRTNMPFHYNTNRELKKLALFFDKIYFSKPSVKIIPSEITDENTKNKEFLIELNNELRIYDYLQSCNIIEEYNSVPANKSDAISQDELEYISDYLEMLKHNSKVNNYEYVDPAEIEKRFQNTLVVADIQARVDAIELSRTIESEFYPILKSSQSFIENGKKSQVIHFILTNIPEPDENTPWEQIIDFRADTDTRLKYLAIINWINEIAKSNFSVIEIKEKYEYLFLDFKRNYDRHKIKSNLSSLEIIASAGVAFFTGNIPTALNLVSHFLKIGTSVMNMVKEEGTIPGREVAYINKVNLEFR